MNDANYNKRAFTEIVARLQGLGAPARLPLPGEGPDVYLAQLLEWMLDVSEHTRQAKAMAYYRGAKVKGMMATDHLIDHDAEKLQRGERLETPKAHVTEKSGRSYRIECAVVDGKVIKPGEPLPPLEGE